MNENDRSDLRGWVLEQLAMIMAVEVADLEAMVEETGDLVIDSKQGQTVAILVEVHLGIDGLVRGQDQTPANLSSLSALEAMLSRRIEATADDKAPA